MLRLPGPNSLLGGTAYGRSTGCGVSVWLLPPTFFPGDVLAASVTAPDESKCCGNSSLGSLLLRRLRPLVVPAPCLIRTARLRSSPLGSGREEWSACRAVQPIQQILQHQRELISEPLWQTLTTHGDTVLALEKLPPSPALALNVGPNAKRSGHCLSWTVFFKWTVLLQKNGDKC